MKITFYRLLAMCLLLPFAFFNVQGQQIYLPKKTVADSVTFAEYMPTMARQIIKRLGVTPVQKKDGEYYNKMFVLHSIAQQYKSSNKSIDSVRMLLKPTDVSAEDYKGYLNIYENYNFIKLIQAGGDKHSLGELYRWAFPIVLGNLKGKAFTYAVEPYAANEDEIEPQWQAAVDKIKARQSDSLMMDDAITFARAYLRYLVYKPFLAVGKQVVYMADDDNFIVQDSTLIPMRDGVKLSAVIVRNKKVSGPQPAVIINNIYATPEEVNMAKGIVYRGYTGIILNTRGKYVSEGAIEPWEHDAEDTYDAIDWISKQSWSNGKVGMFGGSYLGFTQWAATKKMHPALKTIIPQVAAAPGIDFPMRYGARNTYGLRWLSSVYKGKMNDNATLFDMKRWTTTFNKWYTSGRAFNSLDTIDEHPIPMFQTWMKHPSYDEYWQKMIPYKQEFSKINIPVLSITGYFDGDQFGALYYYRQHHQWNPSANHYLVIGPYDHFGAQGSPLSVVNGYTLDKAAMIDINKLIIQWLDYTLKDGPKPALLKDTVNYQVMGDDKWAHAPSLKKLSANTLSLYLSPQKNGTYNKLSSKKSPGFVKQTVDFSKRIIDTVSDTYSVYSDTLDSRGAVTFVSDKLEKDVIIAGSFTADLAAAINKKDMDIIVSVSVQQPHGKYLYLSSFYGRASYLKDISHRHLLKPGVKETLPIIGSFTSKRITKGSRFIVQLSIAKGANFETNYGTGKDVATETIADAKQPLEIKWFGDSVIHIPVTTP
jgi:putative CocE/NonD family hydrolase